VSADARFARPTAYSLLPRVGLVSTTLNLPVESTPVISTCSPLSSGLLFKPVSTRSQPTSGATTGGTSMASLARC
jgi:hypothetical protein